jgi:type IX secretion system PorP/SprF family membrane protein
MQKTFTHFVLLLFTFSLNNISAQDIHFSQVLETPMAISPANTGFFNGYVRSVANYRSQWASMGNAFQTLGATVDGGLFKSKKHSAFMGAGFTIYSDAAGAAKLRRTSVLLNLSGIVKLGKYSVISVGLAGGTMGTNANYSKLTFASQFGGNSVDPSIANQELPYRQFTTVDVAAGGAYEFDFTNKDQDHDDKLNFRISVGAFHLNRPVQDFTAGSKYKLPVKMVYAFTSEYDFKDTKFTITPTFIYQQQSRAEEIYMGSYIKYRVVSPTKVTGKRDQNALGVGLFYRRDESLIPSLIFDMGNASIALAYDINVSRYTTASRGFGGFEIALRYNALATSLFDARKEFK